MNANANANTNTNKKPLIQLGELSIYLIYPALIPISRIIKNKTIVYFEGNHFEGKPVTSTGLMFLAQIIGGALYWIQSCSFCSQYYKKEKEIRNQSVEVFSNTLKIIKDTQLSLWYVIGICSIGICDLIGTLSFYSYGTADFNYLMMTVQIFLYALLSYKVLHNEVYYHQYLSIGLVIIGVILVNVQIDLNEVLWYWIILSFATSSCYAIQFTIQKKLMQIRYNPLFLLFFAGITGLTICILIVLGLYAFCPNDRTGVTICNDLDFYYNANMNDFYYLLVYVAFTAVLNVSMNQTNYYFMPTLLVIGDVLSSCLDWIVTSIENRVASGWSIGGYIIIIIGALVYNEIVILNIWKFGNYTRAMINKRSQTETNTSKIELNELSLSNDMIIGIRNNDF